MMSAGDHAARRSGAFGAAKTDRESVSLIGDDPDESSECAVCFGLFDEQKTPTQLPCGHTAVCQSCLREWSNGHGKNPGMGWTCPMCRSVCSTIDQPSPPSCDLCTSGRPAVNYCLDCSEKLCQKCSDHHKEGKKTHSHQIDALNGTLASSGHGEAGGRGENVERGGREKDVLMSPTKKRRMAHVTKGNKIICVTCKVVCKNVEEQALKHTQHEIATFETLEFNDDGKQKANDVERRRAQDALLANDQQKKAAKIEGLRRIDACRQAFLKYLTEIEEEIRSCTYLPWKLRQKPDQERGVPAMDDDNLENYVARREENDAQWRLVSDMRSKLALSNDPGPGISDYLEARVRAAGDASAIKRFEEKSVSSLILAPDRHTELTSMLEKYMGSCLHLERRDVHPARCVAKGPGLEKIFTGGSAHFTLVAHASNGSPCTSGGDTIAVQVFSGDTDEPSVGWLSQEACRGAGAAGSGAAVAAQHQLACDFDYRDHGNGQYSCKYSMPEDLLKQAGRSVKVVVWVNGMALHGSAGKPYFAVHVVEGCSVEFEESRPFEGVIHHLATQGGRSEFENPHISKTVKVSAVPGIERGSLACFVSGPEHNDRANFTKDLSSDGKTSSVQVDLKDWEVVPRYYSIRNDLTLTHMLKSWSLEASSDATDWVTLIDHREVDWSEHSQLAPEQLCFCALSFPISGEITTAFRYFRIVMTDGNWGNSWHLVCSGIEIFGELRRLS